MKLPSDKNHDKFFTNGTGANLKRETAFTVHVTKAARVGSAAKQTELPPLGGDRASMAKYQMTNTTKHARDVVCKHPKTWVDARLRRKGDSEEGDKQNGDPRCHRIYIIQPCTECVLLRNDDHLPALSYKPLHHSWHRSRSPHLDTELGSTGSWTWTHRSRDLQPRLPRRQTFHWWQNLLSCPSPCILRGPAAQRASGRLCSALHVIPIANMSDKRHLSHTPVANNHVLKCSASGETETAWDGLIQMGLDSKRQETIFRNQQQQNTYPPRGSSRLPSSCRQCLRAQQSRQRRRGRRGPGR